MDSLQTRLKSKLWQTGGSQRMYPKIRSFLGLAGYYRRFIKDFAKIAAPLTNLTRKDRPFAWSLREGEAFNALKTVLQNAPVLQLADQSKAYIVTTDASDFAMGAVLSQIWARWGASCGIREQKDESCRAKLPDA